MFGKYDKNAGQEARKMWDTDCPKAVDDKKGTAKILFWILLSAVVLVLACAF